MTQNTIQHPPSGDDAPADTAPTHSPAAPRRVSAPYLARHPWVGWLTFFVFAAVFAWLSWVVETSQQPFHTWDPQIVQSMHIWARQQPEAVVLFMRFMSSYGRIGEGLIALVLTFVWAHQRARRELYMLVFGMLGGEFWFQVISYYIGRARPVFPDPLYTLDVAGYPSGHAVTSVILGMMVLYLLLPYIRSRARRIAFTLAVVTVVVLILFSRLFLGVHYPTDLLAGVALGLAWGALVFTLTDLYFYRRKKEEAR